MRCFLILTLLGCTSEQRVVEDMERSLEHTHVAVAAQLVVTEILARALDAPTETSTTTGLRHGDSCGCPCIERIGDVPPTITTIDYPGTGCVPLSGLVPSTLSGHALVEYDGQAADVGFGELMLARDHAIDGRIEAAPIVDAIPTAVTATLTVGDWSVDLDTRVTLQTDVEVRIDGLATVQGEGLTLDGIVLPWSEIPPPCPSPSEGRATLQQAVPVEIAFDEPGSGAVTIRRRNRVSADVDYCAYRSELF